MAEPQSAPVAVSRRRLHLTGLVQGVGFRPFVFRLAQDLQVTGWVKNTSSGVEMEVEGPPGVLELFLKRLMAEAPPLARVEGWRSLEVAPLFQESFEIRESESRAHTLTVIPPDVGLCSACAREILDPRDRRHRYPFTTCTDCGPRFTLVRRVPYDRRETTMSVFELCAACRREYEDLGDRRFHAETIACPVCGPQVWLEYQGQRREGDVWTEAARLLHDGRILAVKGLGGFHLAVDAANDQAVQVLRQRKHRPDKPLALMVRDLATASRLAEIGERERHLLLSPERPIVLCRKRPGSGLAPSIAPGNRYLGLMLPYTPLHLLLLERSPPALVMTSGNLAAEPLVFTNAAAIEKLSGLADALLLHDRDIYAPCDDSLLRPLADGTVIPLRRARGYVPRTLPLPVAAPEILALGADQKNTFCLAWEHTALMSQHLGDLESLETYEFWQQALRHFLALSRKDPRVLVHDLHPGYISSRYAREQKRVRLMGVQHHHAHVAACLAENGRTGPCIGLTWDGTGYGPDGSLWGGEFLVADLWGFTRAAHLAPVRLPGGEAAVKNPGRMAVAYLQAAFGDHFASLAAQLGLAFSDVEWRIMRRQLAHGWHAPLTTSAGRLFDAVAAATGLCRRRTYEGQPAVALEMAADPEETGGYPVDVRQYGETLVLDTPALFRWVVSERLAGVAPEVIAARFHQSLVAGVARICRALRERTDLNLVALSGGVFQNGLLLSRLKARLEAVGFEVLIHRQVPPNDGGLSLGQAAVAAARLSAE